MFIDQDAVPTLVEVKRATNRELRRDVVGQMFDYAANAIRFWSVDDLEAAAERTHGRELNKVIKDHTAMPVEAFWSVTQENLRQGRVRLMFVADEIPVELQTIVEFVNESSREAEILAVEVRQYSGSTSTVLVPRLFGQTSVARHRRRLEGPGFQELFDRAPHEVQRAVRLLRDWAAEHEVTEVQTTRGLRLAMGDVHLMYVQPGNHSIQLTMKSIRSGDPDLAAELMAMLEGFSSRDSPLTNRHPQLPLVDVRDHWDRVRHDFLPAYLRGRLRHSARRPLW